MLIFQNATRPAPRSTSRPSRTIARRDRQNVSKALNMRSLPKYTWSWRSSGSSLGRYRADVAHKQRPLGGDEFPGLQPFEELYEPVLLQADLDRPLDQVLAVGGDPYHQRAVALAHETVSGDAGRLGWGAGQNAETGEHVWLELPVPVVDLGAHGK